MFTEAFKIKLIGGMMLIFGVYHLIALLPFVIKTGISIGEFGVDLFSSLPGNMLILLFLGGISVPILFVVAGIEVLRRKLCAGKLGLVAFRVFWLYIIFLIIFSIIESLDIPVGYLIFSTVYSVIIFLLVRTLRKREMTFN